MLHVQFKINNMWMTFSYKEDSEGSTDSDDVIDYEEDSTLVSVPLEDVETIEKIVRHRNGRKGGNEIFLDIHKN